MKTAIIGEYLQSTSVVSQNAKMLGLFPTSICIFSGLSGGDGWMFMEGCRNPHMSKLPVVASSADVLRIIPDAQAALERHQEIARLDEECRATLKARREQWHARYYEMGMGHCDPQTGEVNLAQLAAQAEFARAQKRIDSEIASRYAAQVLSLPPVRDDFTYPVPTIEPIPTPAEHADFAARSKAPQTYRIRVAGIHYVSTVDPGRMGAFACHPFMCRKEQIA